MPAEPGSSFVGRERVLGELGRFVAEAAAGHGGLMLVAGDPGIGKTSLLGALVARSPGVRAIWGSCWEGEGAPALWPWIQILRQLARHWPADQGDTFLGRLLPELGGAVRARVEHDEQARFALFDAVARYLESAALESPLLLVLEDLHWADTSTLLLLGFLIPELRTARIAVVGTYRDLEVPAGHTLHRILSARSGVVPLGGLDAAEVAELARIVTAVDPSPGAAEELHRTTGGNPFFVREMLRLHDPSLVPDSVGEVIRRRVARLSPECRELLHAAAVLGGRVRLDVLARLADTTPLAEAISARLMEEDPALAGHLRFSHALVREVLYRDLRAGDRMGLHRRTGEALEALSADEAELAHHFAQSSMLGTAEKAVEYAERAGVRALGLLAYEDAATHFERALALMSWTDSRRRARLLLSLGRALRAAGRTSESQATLQLVAEVAPDGELLAEAALAFCVEFTAGVVDQAEIRLLERALDALPEVDHPLRARVLARLAKALLFTPATARRAELSEAAAGMARRAGDPVALAAVLYDRHVAIWGGANVDERLAIASEVVELAARNGDEELSLQGRALRMGNLLELGDITAMQAEIEAYDSITTRLRLPAYLWHVPLLRATLATFACRFDAAERFAAEGLALGRRAKHQGVAVFYASAQATIRFAQGRFAEMEPVLRQGAEQWPSIAMFRCALAFALVEGGKEEEARQEVERLTAGGLANVPRDFTWVGNLALLALAVAALGERRTAELLYELLLPYRALCVRLTRIGVSGLGAVAHHLGVLAAAMGRWEEAARLLEQAVETNVRIGAPAFVANSRYQYARVLRALGATERAREEARRAELASKALGFELALRRVEGAAGEARPEPPSREGRFEREGEYWAVRFRGPTLRLKASVGLAYLARLISEQGREVHVLDLSGAGPGAGLDTVDGAPILDARAKADFRRRLEELDEETREAEARGEVERASRAREELDALGEELARAVGLGGRDRHAASEVERARTRVTKAIKAAVRRIAEHDRVLADHLEHSIRTGTFCSYTPDPTVRVEWRT